MKLRYFLAFIFIFALSFINVQEVNAEIIYKEDGKDIRIECDGNEDNVLDKDKLQELFANNQNEDGDRGTIYISKDVKLPDDSSGLFSNCTYNLVFEKSIDTSNVTNMSSMFLNIYQGANNTNLFSIKGLEYFNTSNVTDMSCMFQTCFVKDINVANWDVSKVKDMSNMFSEAMFMNPDVSNWNVKNVESFASMFFTAVSAKPDISKWQFKDNIEGGSFDVFLHLTSVEALDVRNWGFLSQLEESLGFFGADRNLREFILPSVKYSDNLEGSLIQPTTSLINMNPTYEIVSFVRKVGEAKPQMFKGPLTEPNAIAKYYTPLVIDWKDKLKYYTDLKFEDGEYGKFEKKVPDYKILSSMRNEQFVPPENPGDNSWKDDQRVYFSFQQMLNYKDGILGATKAEDKLDYVIKIPQVKINDDAQEMAHVGWIKDFTKYEDGKRKIEIDGKTQRLFNLDLKDYDKSVEENKDISFKAAYKIKATFENKSDDIDYIKVFFNANGGNFKDGSSSKEVWVLKDFAKLSDVERLFEKPKKMENQSIGWSESPNGSILDRNRAFSDKDSNKSFYAIYSETPSFFKILTSTAYGSYIKGYTDNNFAPKKTIKRSEIAQIFYNSLKRDGLSFNADKIYYTDINKNSWYYEAVVTDSAVNVFLGYTDKTFRPDGQITRAEFIATVRRFKNIPEKDGNNMNLRKNHWAIKEVQAAYEKGWLEIYKNNIKFKEDEPITREEVVAILNKAFNRPIDSSYIDKHINSLKTFNDISKDMWSYYDIICASNTYLYYDNWTNHALVDSEDLNNVKWFKPIDFKFIQAKFK